MFLKQRIFLELSFETLDNAFKAYSFLWNLPVGWDSKTRTPFIIPKNKIKIFDFEMALMVFQGIFIPILCLSQGTFFNTWTSTTKELQLYEKIVLFGIMVTTLQAASFDASI
jgi:hypothetical protein